MMVGKNDGGIAPRKGFKGIHRQDIKDIEERKCTDVCFLCVFVTFWVGMVAIALSAFASGDISGLTFGADYLGNRCGVGNFTDRPKLWYPRLSKDLGEQYDIAISHPWEMALYGLCVQDCPENVHAYSIEDYGAKVAGAKPKAKVWTAEIPTFSTLNRCIPKVETNFSVITLCTKPTCTEVGEPCRDLSLLGVASGAWEITSVQKASGCLREVELRQEAVTKQPNTGPFLEYILGFATYLEQGYEAIVHSSREILLYGIVAPTLMGLGWMIFLSAILI